MARFLLLLILVGVHVPCLARHKMTERYYQQKYCTGVSEYVLPDKTRVDCLTDKYAIEFDFANNWAEAIGQSLHYARMTGRAPAIYIITESPSDYNHLQRLLPLCEQEHIKIFLISNYD